MQQQGDRLGIDRTCQLAGVSRAGYYRHWLASKPRQEETALRDEIQRLSLANKHQGYRLVMVLLKRAGWVVNHKRVQRIRRENNLLCLSGRTFRPATTDGRHGWKVWPNLARHLVPTTVNQLWVADITYVRLDEAFIYLAVVLDAFGRKVVGWVGCPWDNAMAESWMRTLKREEVDGGVSRPGRGDCFDRTVHRRGLQPTETAFGAGDLAPEAYEASQPVCG
jgi:transposase InsO family protein